MFLHTKYACNDYLRKNDQSFGMVKKWMLTIDDYIYDLFLNVTSSATAFKPH